MARVKNRLAEYYMRDGQPTVAVSERYQIEAYRRHYMFAVTPCPAPRMSQSDKWRSEGHTDPRKRRRPIVSKYFAFRDAIKAQAMAMKFELGQVLEAVFFVPMPDSWSEKKKERHSGLPCLTKPDCDNYTKALCDAMKKEDGEVWLQNCQKRYAYVGAILIYQ